MSQELEVELKERLHSKKLDKLVASFAGACISNGHMYSTDNGREIFVKTNSSLNAAVMFDGEFQSLRHINSTRTVKAPREITVIHNYDKSNTSAIVMEFLRMSPLKAECGEILGHSLAHLHNYNNKVIKFEERASRWVGKQAPSTKHFRHDRDQSEEKEEEENQFTKHQMRVKDETQKSYRNKSEYPDRFTPHPNTGSIKKFGFIVPTSCGSIPQVNEWTEDWVSFYARHRLDVTIRSLLSDHSDRELNQLWSHLQIKMSELFIDFDRRGSGEGEITPALLHGDLWSGNAAQLSDGSEGVFYDPASFYGHSEYEFGIVRMFGGFPREFEKAYFQVIPKKKNFERRNKLYQLFHYLNHWNHFGSGYRQGTLSLMKSLI